jgi:dynein assembly factor 3
MSIEGAGAVRFWGFSEARDLLGDLTKAREAQSDPDSPLRALLLCPGDVRHLLHTLASLARTNSAQKDSSSAAAPPVEFAIYEREPEVLARHMLLLAIALDFELPRRERAELLLEVWANTQVREKTAAYIATKAAALGRAIAHDEGPLAPLFDIASLKSRDRDALEQVLRTWAENVEFDIVKLRDERLRAFYKGRYDHRKNVLEWDHSMELVEIDNCSIVHRIHWREWRMTGIAYEVRDSSYNAPNRTLASMCMGKSRSTGTSIMKRGFWGDVANGPWAATGVSCVEGRLTNKKGGHHHKSSCDLAYYNVLDWLTSLETGQNFHLKEEDIADFEYGGSVSNVGGGLSKGFLSAKGDQAVGRVPLKPVEEVPEGGAEDGEDELLSLEYIAEEMEAKAARRKAAAAEDAKAAEADAKRAASERARIVAQKMAKLPPFTVKLLGGDWLDVQRKPRHQKAFDLLVVATHVAYVMASDRLNGILKPEATCLIETAKFLVEIRKQNRTEYASKLLRVAARIGWELRDEPSDGASEPDGCKVDYVAFAYDEAKAPELAEAVRAADEAARKAAGMSKEDAEKQSALPELTMREGAGDDDGAHAEEGAESSAKAAAKMDPSSIGMLKIADDPAPADVSDAAGAPAPSPAMPVKTQPGTAAAMSAGGGKVCAITGKPAKYRDPISGLPYADLAAFKELRKLHPDPKKLAKEEEAPAPAEDEGAGEGGAGKANDEERPAVVVPSERPIRIGENFSRRVNKVW